jgi:hypothetical protein
MPNTQPQPQQPNIISAIEDAARAAYDNVKARFLAGPPAGTLSADPGSVLGQRDAQLQTMSPQQSPLQQQQLPLAPALAGAGQSSGPQQQPPYGGRPGEMLLDIAGDPVSGGLRGVKRN